MFPPSAFANSLISLWSRVNQRAGTDGFGEQLEVYLAGSLGQSVRIVYNDHAVSHGHPAELHCGG